MSSLNQFFIQQKLLDSFGKMFEKEGFEQAAAEVPVFRKKFDGGFKSCFFSIVENEEQFWIECSLGIRIDAVEVLANQFTLSQKKYYPYTHTILTSYGKMKGNQYFRFKVQNEEELATVCMAIREFLNEMAFYFLENNTSVFKIDQLINETPETPSNYITNKSSRCIKGIILARFCQNPEFNKLVKTYFKVMKSDVFSHLMLKKYVRLVNHLRITSVN